jgi:gliding motility-associated-like protein
VFFKVVDSPPVVNGLSEKLVDSKIWKIRVLAPSVSNLSANVKQGGNAIIISWTPYTCALNNAQVILYRKQGNCLEAPNSTCSTGMTLSGFTEIARLKSTVSQFEDSNVGKNKNYVYVAVVTFFNENGVEDVSPMSNTTCLYIPTSTPIITNVSVTKTDTNLGEMLIRWTRPNKLDTTLYNGPYFYQITRADGSTSSDFKNVSALLPAKLFPAVADTTFTDIGLNTSNNIYSYKVKFYYSDKGQTVLMDASNQASNVYLYGQSNNVTKIDLAWLADVPWSNDYQIHRLYREYPRNSGNWNQIADVSVAGQSTYLYTDLGKDNIDKDGKFDIVFKKDSTYCYLVETVGEYKQLLANVKLVNASRKVCLVSGSETNSGGGGNPSDNLKPCPPTLKIENLDCLKMNESKTCVFDSFTNLLSWTTSTSSTCDLAILKYNIYYSNTESGIFKLIGSTDLLSKSHVKTDGIRGWYYVTAVNTSGIESAKSNLVNVDNCPNFELPNLFSPNGDLKNDVWLPMFCPRFVTKITCKIVDRYGQIVYEYEGDINQFGWDGKNKAGKFAAASTYFYECSVEFDVLDEANKMKYLKGWVELVK